MRRNLQLVAQLQRSHNGTAASQSSRITVADSRWRHMHEWTFLNIDGIREYRKERPELMFSLDILKIAATQLTT